MASNDFNSAIEISKTRSVMNLRLGEIISVIIGDSRVKELFDQAGKHPDEYAGQPTGEMALKLNVLTPGTKTALLVAQAAERAYKLAEKAESYAQNHESLVDYYKKKNKGVPTENLLLIDEKSAGVVRYNDPVFKFVGAERDPELLKTAQATWMAAQIYLNQEVASINKDVPTMGFRYADGFKKAAAGFYTQAAQLLSKEGHVTAGEKLDAVAKTLDAAVAGKAAPIPSQFLNHLLNQAISKVMAAHLRQDGGEYYLLPKEYEDTLQKLLKLTTPQPPPPAADTSPKPGG